MQKRVLCFLLAALLTAQLSAAAFAVDTFLYENHVNYSWSTGKTQDQCNNAYTYLSTVMDTRYTERIYDLIYRAQFRLTLFGGDNWPYLNTGVDTTLVEDSVLGRISISASRGCNSYARFGAKYVRGMQGTLKRASDYLGKANDYVPNAAEIKRFIERYADVGERILTGYYNASRKAPRPHSLLFLGEDAQKDGFYFLCQDGDGNGQTIRYFTYDYMATRLRYYEEYGYALAIGDTNSGRDSVPNDTLFGAVDASALNKLSFSQENGYTTTVTGWALSKTNTAVHVRAYADGAFLAQAASVTNTKIRSIFPAWDTTGQSGFSLPLDLSALCTGKHVLDIYAEDGSERVLLKRINICVENLVYTLETPMSSETIVLQAEDLSVPVQGWCFDRSGEQISCCYAVDEGARKPLTPQKREDIAAAYGCQDPNVGFACTLNLEGTTSGAHTVHIYAHYAAQDIEIVSFPIYVLPKTVLQKEPILLQIARLPDRLDYDFGETLSLDGMVLKVVYNDLTVDVLHGGYSVSGVTNIPGTQTVVLAYSGITAEYQIFVRDPVSPQSITLTAERDALAPSQTTHITTSILPADAQAYTVVWESSNPAAATIDADGTVTGVARGDCEIVAVVYDYCGNEVCRDSITIRVRSAFRLFWLRIRNWFRRLFGIRSTAALVEE